jgi:hypothetical protein
VATTTRATALNQLLAARKGVRTEVNAAATSLFRDAQKIPLLTGFTKTYRKIDDNDADLPGEAQRLQVRLPEVLDALRGQYTRLWDLTATIDATNCAASADVVVDGETLVSDAPVSFLLFLEKQLGELHEFVTKLPVLDPAERWDYDANVGAYATPRSTTVRSKKVPRNHVLAEATERHPAQVQVWQEDVPVGYWDTIRFSGAIPADRKSRLLARVSQVRQAVKMAREKANMTEVRQQQVSDALFAHIFAE